MSDPTGTPSTGLSTGEPGTATPQGSFPAQPVNPAQTSPLQPPVPQQQQSMITSDVSGLMANYESRISKLMSEKDKALNERNQAISSLADLQKAYTSEKEQSSQTLNSTATAAQSAIDQARVYEAQIRDLQADLLRARTLLAKPHLAGYEQFIPKTADAAEMQTLIDQLEQIRNSDLERSRGAYQQPMPQQQQQPFTPSPLPPQNVLNLYQNRPNLAPGVVPTALPGSSPALMNPNGAGDPTDKIQEMLSTALKSSDPSAYTTALEQAKTLANATINQQLNRS